MNSSELEYLAARLALIDSEQITKATEIVRKAQSSLTNFEWDFKAEHALYHTLWDYVSQTIDHSDFSPEHSDALESLEAELAGRTLTIRLKLGWITKSPTAPDEFPQLNIFLNSFED